MEKAPLSTEVMRDILKGDTFPVHQDSFLTDDICLFFSELFSETGMRKADVIRKANLARSYGYQIMGNHRLGKRDYYLCLALAMSLDLTTTQRMLAVTKSGALHPLIKRDAATIFAINHGYSLEQTYDFFLSLDLAPLNSGLEG